MFNRFYRLEIHSHMVGIFNPAGELLPPMDKGTIKIPNPKCLVYNRVYGLEIHSVMLVFSTSLVYCCPSTFSLTSPPLPLPTVNVQHIQTLCGCGGGVGVLSCVVDHILQEFNTLFLTRFRNYKIATPPQTKRPVETTFRDWCL